MKPSLENSLITRFRDISVSDERREVAEAPTGLATKVSRRFHPGAGTLLPSCLRQAGRG